MKLVSWGGVAAFFAMGGYAFYVWGSYGVVAAALALEVLLLLRRRRTLLRRLGRMHRMGGGAGRGGGAVRARVIEQGER